MSSVMSTASNIAVSKRHVTAQVIVKQAAEKFNAVEQKHTYLRILKLNKRYGSNRIVFLLPDWCKNMEYKENTDLGYGEQYTVTDG